MKSVTAQRKSIIADRQHVMTFNESFTCDRLLPSYVGKGGAKVTVGVAVKTRGAVSCMGFRFC